ncbi:hypothetical protein BGZ63DRAFT_401617 [Mariannaea sp. PMI_226]|nr:hypothetical protein BGZ63DRAFT_401617 [Mariannaea sp. PMI_226]
MDHRRDSRQRSPHRSHHRSHEWSDRRSQDRDRHQRDSRSRSPEHKRSRRTLSHDEVPPRKRDDRQSSSRHHRSSHRHRERGGQIEPQVNPNLPFSARPLSKADLPIFEPLLAQYLDLQKQKDINEMDDREVKGRWKSFVGKWNRGELAEGWYDPEVFARAKEEVQERPRDREEMDKAHEVDAQSPNVERERDGSDEDDYGPVLPGSSKSTRRAGPGIPTLQDLSLRAEMEEEDKQASIADLRSARKADRALQKERLDDLVPRAEAGTRERQLEKKQLLNEKMRSFREKSPGMDAGDEREIMGGGDSLEEYKNAKEREQKRKTEREIRREEIERAKQEEMEEKRRAWREREEGTVSMLRELARQRFG